MENTTISEFKKNWGTELASAFHLFNEYTLRLEESYNLLQNRVKEIDKEMAYTNACLKDKVQELDSLTKYSNNLLSSIHSGVIAVNLKGEISTINKAAEKILGLDALYVMGKKVENIFKNSDGSTPLLLLALEKRRNCIDVERKIETIRGEMRLRNADKLAAIGAMAACIAHEIRNPLNGIEGFSALLARDFEDSDPRKKLVKNIIQGTKNLNKTVTELLVFARPLKLKLKDHSISEVLDKTLFFVTEDIKQKGINNIRIQKEYNLEKDTVRCDPEKLQQAFLNLCLNAIQSMTCGGDLTVFTRVLGDDYRNEGIQVGIKDSGVGIKKELVHKIFDPFFTTKQEGTGLGLAIVNKIIEAHNGKIFVESIEGSGATFSINLPKNNIYDTDSFGDMYSQNEALMPQFL